jgi:hypothetical protein
MRQQETRGIFRSDGNGGRVQQEGQQPYTAVQLQHNSSTLAAHLQHNCRHCIAVLEICCQQ